METNILNIDLTHKTFNLTSALAYMIFWIIFSFTTPLLNCDMRRLMTNNVYVQHLIGILGFFFLMAITSPNNTAPIYVVWLKSFLGYLIFMLFIKSDIYVAGVILLILGVDQTIAYHIDYLKQTELNNIDNKNIESIKYWEGVRDILMYVMGLLIIIGVSIYVKHAYDTHNTKEDMFSIIKFIIGTNTCKNL